jgi:hypothetical protein
MGLIKANGKQYYAVPEIVPGVGSNDGPAVIALIDVKTGEASDVVMPNSTYNNIIVGGIVGLPDGSLLTTVDSAGLYCIGLDGEERWSVLTGSQGQNCPIVLPDGRIAVSTKYEQFDVYQIN